MQLYFVAVGSQDYALADPKRSDAFAPVFAPENSARRIAETLLAAGAAHGILLTSDALGAPGRARVTREDVLTAVVDLKARIRRDGAANPRIVFYFMGHGLGDRVSAFLYMLPGDIVFDAQASQAFTSRLLKRTVSDLDIVSALAGFRVHPSMAHLDRLFPTRVMGDPLDAADMRAATTFARDLVAEDEANRRAGRYPPEGNPPVPYVVLFDNRYGGVAEDIVRMDTAERLAGPVLADLRATMAEAASDGVVLYAVRPGKTAYDYVDPVPGDGETPRRVGPLALRFLAMLAARSPSTRTTFGDLRAAMTAPRPARAAVGRVDPPVPHLLPATDPEILASPVFPQAPAPTGDRLEVRRGTGASTVACCRF